MGDFYGDMQGIASGLLTQFKQGSISILKVVSGVGPAYNPGDPLEVATLLPGGTATGSISQYVVAGLATAGDLLVVAPVVAGLTINQATDKVLIDGVPWKIVQFMPTPPVGTAVVWKFIVRR